MRKMIFRNSNICHISQNEIHGEPKVRDHCHLTGQYRGVPHESYNLNFKHPNFIPVFLHNNTHHDTHQFILELSKTLGNISAIPNTDQKYISFTKTISRPMCSYWLMCLRLSERFIWPERFIYFLIIRINMDLTLFIITQILDKLRVLC